MKDFGKVQVTKKEYEVIRFLQTGSNNFWDAYYNYEGRKKRIDRPMWTIVTWFNKVVKCLHTRKLFLEVPFIYHSINATWAGKHGFVWINPGLNGVKSNLECFTIQETNQENKSIINKII